MMNKLLSTKVTKQSAFAVLCLLSSLALIALGVKHSFYLYIQVIGSISGYYILKDTEHLSVISILLLGFLWGTAILVFVAALASMLTIRIQPWLMGIPTIILIFFLFHTPIEVSKVRFKVAPAEAMLVFFTFLALASRVLSIKGFTAPMLHDPISHATWANDIVQTGIINTYYSPGLHIVSAFGNMVDGISTATYVLRLTNLFNALFIIPVFYYLEAWLKNKWISVVGTFIFFVSLFPARFFWTGGKNALVMNLPFFFLILFVYIALRKLNNRRIVIVNLLLFVTIINHYPSAAITLVALLSYVLSDGLRKNINALVIGSGLGVLWGISKLRLLITNSNTSVANINIAPSLTIQNFTDFIASSLHHIREVQFNFPQGDLLVTIGLVFLLAIMLLSIKKRDYLPFIIFVMLSIVMGSIIFFIQPIRNYLYIIYETQVLTFFLTINLTLSIVAGLFLTLLTSKNHKDTHLFIGIGLLVLIAIFTSKVVYSEYRERQSSLNMVSWNDVGMFEWIDENVDQEEIVLNNAAQNENRFIVFTSDGASWIPAFTNNEIAMPFDEFDSNETLEIYQVYLRLLSQKYTCQDIDYLLGKNISYYYLDSNGVFGPQFEPGKIDSNFHLLKEIGGVELYKIVPCQDN